MIGPEWGLNRLDTHVLEWMRCLCEQDGIAAIREKPLHGLVGEYGEHLGGGPYRI